MATQGGELVRRLVARAEDPGPEAGPPPGLLSAVTGLTRFIRALRWVEALAAVFAGTYRPVPPLRRTPLPLPASPSRNRPRPRPNRAAPVVTTAMRQAFATRPIGTIVEKLCRQLGIAPGTEAWPTDLIALTETPVEWAAASAHPASPAPATPDATPPLDPAAPKPTRQMRRWLAARARQAARHQRAPHRAGRDPP